MGGVPVQAAAGTVIPHGGSRISMRRGFLDVAQRDPSVERGGNERMPSFRSRRVLRICVVIRAGGIRVVKFAPVMMSRVAIPAAAA